MSKLLTTQINLKMKRLFKNSVLGFLLVASIALVVACTKKKDSKVSQTEIRLDKKSVSLNIGEKANIKVTILPDNASDKSVVWTTNNDKVAIVDNGLITAKGVGEAIITVNSTTSKLKAECKVVVTKPTIRVKSISINKSNHSLVVGSKYTLIATVLPKEASNKAIIWSSSNKEVASVDNGIITALKVGESNIIAKTVDGNFEAKCKINVTAVKIPVKSISLDKTDVEIMLTKPLSLKTNILPLDATNKAVVWSSSNENIAVVNNGVITTKNIGETVIKATTVDGNFEAICNLKVIKLVIPVTGINLDKETKSLVKGTTFTLNPTILPANATNKELIWETSNKAIATVEKGLVTAIEVGEATIKVSTVDGKFSANCNIIVTDHIISVASISLNESTKTLNEGEKFNLIPTILPENATNKTIIWTSSNEELATVENGLVTAKKAGELTIIATTEDGSKKAECKFTIKKAIIPVAGVEIDIKDKSLVEGSEFNIIANILPSNATNKKLIWDSSNKTVASVDNGHVRALSVGESDISVSTEDGGYKAICKLVVTASSIKVSSVSLDKSNHTINEGEQFTLVPSILPANATNTNVVWSSTNEEVASVVNGVVSGKKAGETKIIVETEDGKFTAECNLTVNKLVIPVESISLDKSEHSITEGEKFTLTANVLPVNATNMNVVWSSSNEEIANVNNGVVTTLKAGDVNIIATTEVGSFTAKCVLHVQSKAIAVSGIRLNHNEYDLIEGEKYQLQAEILPINATNKNIIWTSSNTDIVSVINGEISGLKSGEANVIATTEDGGFSASCKVIVSKRIIPIENINITNSISTLLVGNSYKLEYEILPLNASNKDISWSSENEEIISVDQEGNITAHKVGETVINVKSKLGSVSTNINIKVVEKIEFNDEKFKAALIEKGVDKNNDGEIDTDEALLTQRLYLYGKEITDASGIENFTNLTYLYMGNNKLTSLDVTKLTKLTYLNIYYNKISSIDLSQNTNLEEISAFRAGLQSLDITNCIKIKILDIYRNNVTSIDLSNNTELTDLNFGENKITNIDLSTNIKLRNINFKYCNLSSLDVSMCKSLIAINCTGNPNLKKIYVNSKDYAEAVIGYKKDPTAVWVEK
jgi:uncharacterized protein YjdB